MPVRGIGIDEYGNMLPDAREEVHQMMDKISEEGELVAIISEFKGEVCLQIFGPPNEKVYTILETACINYRKLLIAKQ
jgi:hypothetical protein